MEGGGCAFIEQLAYGGRGMKLRSGGKRRDS